MITKIKHFLHLSYLYFKTRIVFLFNKPPKVLDSLESLKRINSDKLSISRYGDGEFALINGKSIKFQDSNSLLSKRLEEILYSNEEKFKVCIPCIYAFKSTRMLKYNEEIFWLEQINNYKDIYLNKRLRKNTYFDACFSRFYIRYKNPSISKALFKEVKKLWDKQDLLIVEGKYSRLGVGNDLFKNTKSIKRILCPNKNAFNSYDKILKSVLDNYKGQLVLVALGPTATVLSYDLFKKGIRSIDIGHLDLEYEWYLSNAKEKQLVNNKIVNEVEEDNKLTDIKEKEYVNSIISEIK